MNHQEVLRTLLGSSAASIPPLVSPPASGWRSGVGAWVRRERSRIESRIGPPRERVTWAAAPGHRRRYPALRQALLGGYLWTELPSDSPVRLLQSTTAFEPTDVLSLGSGGGVRQRGVWDGNPVLARLGLQGSPADPSWHFAALQRFDLEQIPRGVASGQIDGVSWSIEAYRPGRSPTRLSLPQARQAADFVAKLPQGTSRTEVIDRATDGLMKLAVDLSTVSEAVDARFTNLPAFVSHGDFWSGNLLFEGDRLTGVIDWDSWSEHGAPGLDVLHMWAEELRRLRGVSYGELVEQRFWSEETVRSMVADYFTARSLDWQPDTQLILAAGWWMTAAAGAVRRNPTLAFNDTWIERNVTRPAATFAALLA
ncbi:MAG: phosphotransferase [Acidimicrobiia bacterium]|nr:phosphotransferase [Acidimicrobiia bacterium]